MSEPTRKPAGCGVLFFRIALVIGMAFLGLAAGTWLGGRYLMPQNQGLAAPAIALGYGLVGAVVAGVLALVLAFLLKGALLKTAGALTLIAALVLSVAFFYKLAADEKARQDPEAAYAGIPAFTASLEQTVITDPYLRVKIEVDAAKKKWTMTGPGPQHQVCRGTIRAKRLQDLATAVAALHGLSSDDLTTCIASADQATRRLVWELADGSSSGLIEISQECLDQYPRVAAMVRALDNASRSPTSRVDCD